MPTAPPRRCVRCKQLFTTRDCPTCHPPWGNKPASWRTGSGRRWRKVRAAQLDAYPLCAWCGRPADTVDHIDGTNYDTQRYDPAMLRSLCTPCHDKRTRQQSIDARRTGDG